MKMFQAKVVEKIKTHILCSIMFFRKWFHLSDNMEKYGGARQATDDNIIRRMRFACWVTKATDTHTYIHTHIHTYIHTNTHTYTHTYIQTHSIDPSSVQDGMNMILVTKNKGKEKKERRGR